MNVHASAPSETTPNSDIADIIKLAVLAVGGQGGGVLTGWIADLASKGGYAVQMTSVAGVAQRTGATIYYVEMAPRSDRNPVFAQSPSPGDVDILIAAELMEAGRAVMRGFVTPDRTTLIASTHRILAVSEKQVPGDGRSDNGLVEDEITKAALKAICFDMETIAADAGSVISASLFGGLAKSGALPFETALFEDVIRSAGRGVEQSLAAFRGALNHGEGGTTVVSAVGATPVSGPPRLIEKWTALQERVAGFDPECRKMVEAGLRKVVDYQDVRYGEDYLSHVETWSHRDSEKNGFELTRTAAKYIANAMCYDDILRVADLKIRESREQRLRREQQAYAAEIVQVTEYFHPRAEEICGTLPAPVGAWMERTPWAFKTVNRLFNKGRRIRTDRLSGYLPMRFICLFKPHRRSLFRHRQETAHLKHLLDAAEAALEEDYKLAVEVLSCQRLVKGYSDTHARGQSKFTKVLGALEQLRGRSDAADWIRRLREIALKDEKGAELDGALETIRSFATSS